MDFLAEYGLFLAKTATILIALVILVIVVVGLGHRGRQVDKGHIEVLSVNDNLENITRTLKQVVMNPEAFKQDLKDEKKRAKQGQKAKKKEAKEGGVPPAPRVFVIDFDGDVQASAVTNLREEVTAVLSVAEATDEIVVRLESPGGLVHGYGLAASQLSRVVKKGIPLTVAVDKVAASGGYMMACIASRIIAAPFALLGSIGVIAQVPNFHRLLKNKDVDVEVLTAGEYKRTLTMFGENTEKGRQKFLEELEDVHQLFKEFVYENRPIVDIEAVATGEAWYGKRALAHRLVDELKTSDEYLSDRCVDCEVFQVRYVVDKSRVDQLFDRFSTVLMRLLGRDQLSRPEGPHFHSATRIR